MTKLFNQKLLLLVLSVFVLSACGDDDEKAVTKGEFTLNDVTTKIASGYFTYDVSPNEDDEENVYYRNQIHFLGEGLKVVTEDDEYDLAGNGNILELLINNVDQELAEGTYTWQSEENEQPFDLWAGELTLNVNSEDEVEYQLVSGTLTVDKSGSTYKITFTGTAYLVFDTARGLPPVNITAEFEGKLKTFALDF